jgi:hypothetical protein
MWDYEQQPCPESHRERYVDTDQRFADDPSKLSSRRRNEWYERGANHRVEDGKITRDLTRHGWFVDIADLDGLEEFTKKYGEIIIREYPQRTFNQLEIYDGYRE